MVNRKGEVLSSCKGAHFVKDISLTCGRWYLAYPLSDRPVEELLEERGVFVDHATMHRGVLTYSPQRDATFPPVSGLWGAAGAWTSPTSACQASGAPAIGPWTTMARPLTFCSQSRGTGSVATRYALHDRGDTLLRSCLRRDQAIADGRPWPFYLSIIGKFLSHMILLYCNSGFRLDILRVAIRCCLKGSLTLSERTAFRQHAVRSVRCPRRGPPGAPGRRPGPG